MQSLHLSSFTLEQLRSEISEALNRELQTILNSFQPQNTKPRYLTRKEAAERLGVSLPTLHEWTKSGILIGHRVGSRVRYKENEIDASLQQIKTRRATL